MANGWRAKSQWSLFTKRQDALPTNIVKTRRHQTRLWNRPIILKLDKFLRSSAAKGPVTYQSETIT